MTLNIDDPDVQVQSLANALAALTGETVELAAITALRKRLDLLKKEALAEELREISRRGASLPVYNVRTPDEILGYDENGLPT